MNNSLRKLLIGLAALGGALSVSAASPVFANKTAPATSTATSAPAKGSAAVDLTYPPKDKITAKHWEGHANEHPAAKVWDARCTHHVPADAKGFGELTVDGCKKAFVVAFDAIKASHAIADMADDKRMEKLSPFAKLMSPAIHPRKDLGALWGGNEVVSDFAIAHRGRDTLEGQPFYRIMKGLAMAPACADWNVFEGPMFRSLSSLYASKLSGEVHVYLRKWDFRSYYVNVERPQVLAGLKDGRVTKAVFHALAPELADCFKEPAGGVHKDDLVELDAKGNRLAKGERADLTEAQVVALYEKKDKGTFLCNVNLKKPDFQPLASFTPAPASGSTSATKAPAPGATSKTK